MTKGKGRLKPKEIIFMILTWVIVFAGINFLCGLVVKNTYIAVDPVSQESAEKTYGYFEPNQDKVILFPGLEPYQVKINALGLRTVGGDQGLTGRDIQDKYRILAIGDSATFGLFVDDEQSYPYRLQQVLNENHHNAVVLNAGIGGATIPDYLYYMKEKGLKLKPDLVALTFCMNDLEEQYQREKPLYRKMVDDNIFSLSHTIKLAKFMRIFRKWELDRRYRRSLNKKNDERAKRILTEKSQDIDDNIYISIQESKGTVLDPWREDLQPAWRDYFVQLDELIALLKSNDIDLVYIIPPDIITIFDRSMVNYQDILRKYLDERNVAYIDLLDQFKARKDHVLTLFNNPPRDFHFSGKGNQILAQEVYQHIKSRMN